MTSIEQSLDKPFDSTKINISIKPLVIDLLVKRLKSNPPRINLYTEFQRLGNLWKPTEQSRLIESMLIRIPLPIFFFDGTDDDQWEVVDGLQRLWVLKNFVIDKTLTLQNLEYLIQYNNYSFDDLPLFMQSRIEETTITAHIINPGTPREVKYNIFKRINTGGLALNRQEIRHALNPGIPAEFVKELADLEEFKSILNNTVNVARMEDQELITLFIGLYDEINNKKTGEGDLQDFLDLVIPNIYTMEVEYLEKIRKDFNKAIVYAKKIFGLFPFRSEFTKNAAIVKTYFAVWTVALSSLSESELEFTLQNKEIVIKDINTFHTFKTLLKFSGVKRKTNTGLKTTILKLTKLLKERILIQ